MTDYLEIIKTFIFNHIKDNLDECYLIPWDEDDFSVEEIKYITPEMGKIDVDSEFHLTYFNSYNDNYKRLFELYDEPTSEEYFYLLKEIIEKIEDFYMSFNDTIKYKSYEQTI